MSGLQIRKAERRQAKLRLALTGPSGSGKTFSALQLAFGLGGKIGMIDTEHGSGELYAEEGDYDVLTLDPPYTAMKYCEAIKAFEQANYSVIIVDSLSHAWAGEGGLLEKHDRISAKSGNSYTAWRDVTPDHYRLVETMLSSKAHIIGTMRSKTAYEQVQVNGKWQVQKLGMAPVARDGMEYEFTVCMDLDAQHVASASKDRTKLFDGWAQRIDQGVGKLLLGWLEHGAPEAQPMASVEAVRPQVALPTQGQLKEYPAIEARVLNQLRDHFRANGITTIKMRELYPDWPKSGHPGDLQMAELPKVAEVLGMIIGPGE